MTIVSRGLLRAACVTMAIVLAPAYTMAQPIARDFAFFYDQSINSGCPDWRCLVPPAAAGSEFFTESDPRGPDTGAQRLTVGTSSAGGRAGFSGSASSFLPAISVYTVSEPTTTARSFFAGVQRYTVGAGVTSLTLNGQLSFRSAGTVGPRPPTAPLLPRGDVFGGVFIWEASQLDFGQCDAFAVGNPARCFIPSLLDPPLVWPGVTRSSATFDPGTTTGSLTVSGLTPGMDIFVGGWVTTISAFGGFVDATNTVRLSFNAPDVATAAVQEETFRPVSFPVTVPEPASLVLLIAGVTGLLMRCRTRPVG